MRSLVLGDLSESASNPGGETGRLEGSGIELSESVSVEGVLEVLQGNCEIRHDQERPVNDGGKSQSGLTSIVQDGGIIDGRGGGVLPLGDGRSSDVGGAKDDGESSSGRSSHIEGGVGDRVRVKLVWVVGL